jgi:hypothetical protein
MSSHRPGTIYRTHQTHTGVFPPVGYPDPPQAITEVLTAH